MKKLIYILSLILLSVACQQEIDDPIPESVYNGKVKVDFSVILPDSSPVSKAMEDDPQLKSLYLAVFDQAGYLVEYVEADPSDTDENTYSVILSISNEPRYIHWVGNAPQEISYGSEESVMISMKSTGDEDMYWYRRVIPKITTVVANGVETASEETVAALTDVPLIRNFAKIRLVDNAATFTLKSYTVVNALDMGLAACYDFNESKFVEYMDGSSPKSYDTLLKEGYGASTPVAAQYVGLNDAWTKRVSAGEAYYVYEREMPVDNPAYIIAFGEYDDAEVFYKIDLRDNSGNYFPLLRNFEYTVSLNAVNRKGSNTMLEAANSSGSGDVSSSIETQSLIYMSDGNASLEVGYTDLVVTSSDPIRLPFAFYPDLKTLYDGPGGTVANKFNASVEFIINDDATTAGNAINSIGDIDYNNSPYPIAYVNPVPVSENAKAQSVTVSAKYTDPNGIVRTLKRKVKYTVVSKQLLTVECNPSEVLKEKASAFALQLSIPGDLKVGLFPLKFKIESEMLSITTDTDFDHMPVESGKSITGSDKPSFHYIKTLSWDEYQNLKNVNGVRTFPAYFITNKAESATDIYVTNEHFYGLVDGQRLSYAQTHLGNYTPAQFITPEFSPDPISSVADHEVEFTFGMSAMPEDEAVYLTMSYVEPSEIETKLERVAVVDLNTVKYVYKPDSYTGTHSFSLITTTAEDQPVITLSAYHFTDAVKSAKRAVKLSTTINSTIKGEIDYRGNWGNDTKFNATISTEGSLPFTATGNITRRGIFLWYTYEYSISINNWDVVYTDEDQPVTITLVHRGDSYTGTCTLRQLMNGNDIDIS